MLEIRGFPPEVGESDLSGGAQTGWDHQSGGKHPPPPSGAQVRFPSSKKMPTVRRVARSRILGGEGRCQVCLQGANRKLSKGILIIFFGHPENREGWPKNRRGAGPLLATLVPTVYYGQFKFSLFSFSFILTWSGGGETSLSAKTLHFM